MKLKLILDVGQRQFLTFYSCLFHFGHIWNFAYLEVYVALHQPVWKIIFHSLKRAAIYHRCRLCSWCVLILCMLGIFSRFSLACWLLSKLTFSKKNLRETIRASNNLDPDQGRYYVWPDLWPRCLQSVSVDDTSRVKVNNSYLLQS